MGTRKNHRCVFSLVGNYLRPSNNSRPLNFNVNVVVLAVVFVVFCHFSKCFLVHSRIKGEVGAVKLV